MDPLYIFLIIFCVLLLSSCGHASSSFFSMGSTSVIAYRFMNTLLFHYINMDMNILYRHLLFSGLLPRHFLVSLLLLQFLHLSQFFKVSAVSRHYLRVTEIPLSVSEPLRLHQFLSVCFSFLALLGDEFMFIRASLVSIRTSLL